ncbi:DNA damage-inducible protein D [soil metagenome]
MPKGVGDMEAIEIFHFDDSREGFENYGKENGFRYWMATDLMRFLGYDNWGTFRKSINKAMATCAQLNIKHDDNFQQATTVLNGKDVDDYKLSRFACYFTTMFCDNKKPQVQMAFAYFAALASQVQQCLQDGENCERVAIRDEITGHEKVFAGVVKAAGITDSFGYAMVQNAGYRGMYNMNLSNLKTFKGMADQKRTLLDFMGKEELAANLFRITQTEAKIKNEGIKGQSKTETAAELVGKEVRQTMIKISGTAPEDLPLAADIQESHKSIKGTAKKFKKLDSGVTKIKPTSDDVESQPII